MKVQEEIQKKMSEFAVLCQTHQVRFLYAFGSSVTDKFNEKTSDIDLLVHVEEANPIERGEKLISLWEKLEDFFQRKVDLLTDSSVKNPILRKNIESTKILIYDGRGQKVLV